MESYIEDKKNLYGSIYEFLDESDEHNDDEVSNVSFQKLNNFIKSQGIEGDKEEMRQFLEIIKSIGEHHHRGQQFNERMNQLLIHYQKEIKQTLSNSEIFHIFENNKKIVLFLIKKGIITISDEISKDIMNKIENNGNRYCHFFIPELETFLGEEKMKIVKNDLLEKDPMFFTDYEEKREEGENDSYICSLIRQDSVEDFISHVCRQNISQSSKITASIFETNPFLIDNKNTSLIEYSAFFGSVQIFKYLLMKKAELKPSLWLYAIHSKNAEIIYFLESNQVPPPKSNFNKKGEIEEEEEEEEAEEEDMKKIKNSSKNYIKCLIESIKCHHNGISDYIENSLMDQTENNLYQNEEIISNCIKYHNYSHFHFDSITDHGFFYLFFYHYDKLAELLFKNKEQSIKKEKVQYSNDRKISENNSVEVIYYFLKIMHAVPKGYFNGTKIKQIVIPSFAIFIDNRAFCKCSSLTQIVIPSVSKIGKSAFSECSSLTEIIIPSSVTSIEEYTFRVKMRIGQSLDKMIAILPSIQNLIVFLY